MKRNTLLPLGLLLSSALLASGASAQLVIGAPDTETTIAVPTTWCAGGSGVTTVILQGPTVVTSDLTIEPGCIVRGQPRDDVFDELNPLVGAPGSLQIYQGGRIIADGTAASPIIMTTAAVDTDDDGVAELSGVGTLPRKWVAADGLTNFLDDTPTTNPLAPLDTAGNANVRLWGGLTLAGTAPVNKDDPNFNDGVTVLEGTTAQVYGCDNGVTIPCDPADDSGTLDYVSIRHAGDEIGAGNELNGITFGGVGSTTVCSNLEVYANQDDGVEYFGGTVDCSNILIAYIGDDSFDVDQGYTGSLQNGISLSGFFDNNDTTAWGSGGSGDAGGEFDGDDNPPLAAPIPDVSACNITLIGNGTAAPLPRFGANPAVDGASANRGMRLRNNFGGAFTNSIVVNASTSVTTEGTCQDVEVRSIRYANSPAPSFACAGVFASSDVSAGTNLLRNDTPFWDPQGTLSGGRGKLVGTLTTPIDPRAVTVENGIDPTTVGCPNATTYIGATDATAADPLFTDGWTAMSVGGVLPEPGAAPSLAAGALLLLGLVRRNRRS